MNNPDENTKNKRERSGSTDRMLAGFQAAQKTSTSESALGSESEPESEPEFGSEHESEESESDTEKNQRDAQINNFFSALAKNDFDQAKKLIETDKYLVTEVDNPTAEDERVESRTALHYAANNLDMLQHVIKTLEIINNLPFSIDKIDQNLNTPLHLASQAGNPECVSLLLSKCASFTLINNQEQTACECAFNDATAKVFTEQAKPVYNFGGLGLPTFTYQSSDDRIEISFDSVVGAECRKEDSKEEEDQNSSGMNIN